MHIVLVDGSRTGLMIIHRMLAPRGDEIAMFMDGQQALDYVRTTPEAEVLITSFEIATLSGTELCWEARLIADGGRPFYVIAMSANPDPEHVVGVLDAGADDFMAKPPRPDELAARMRVAERTVAMQKRLIHLATRDPLSGLLNRRAFRDQVDRLIGDFAPDEALSLIILDLDHFKRINDLFGHTAGDAVIQRFGGLRLPPDAVFGRLGGEEFAILLPWTPLEAASSVADYVRTQIADQPIATDRGPITVTASFGVAARKPGESFDDLYRRADSALYLAKTSGRNRVAEATVQMAS